MFLPDYRIFLYNKSRGRYKISLELEVSDMSLYFISDKAGVAWASDEYGAHKWSFEDNDFTEFMSTDETRAAFPRRRVTESEAIAFSLKHQPKQNNKS